MKKSIKKNFTYIFMVSVIAFWLMVVVGCSNSGGSGGETPAGSSDLTGILIDSAVEGVDYTTSSGLTGTTDSSGTFIYREGDVVSFSLSGISLGQAQGASEVTVLDIVGASQPSQNQLNDWLYGFYGSEMNNGANALIRRALNISLFLQTLDEDIDPDNGIEITTATANNISNATVSLNFDKNVYDFRSQLRMILTQTGIAKSPRKELSTVRHLVNSGVITTTLFHNTRSESYNNGDGTVDRISTYTYDAYGNRTRSESYNNGDGTTDRISTYAYDVNGNQTRSEYDSDGDGTADWTYIITYDAYGNQTRQESESDGDGMVDRIYTFTYDANGNRTRSEYDYNGDGTADRISTYTYNSNGNQIRQEYDSDGDGTADSTSTYTYDANGNRTRSEKDSDGDGTVDSISTYTYDTNGNRTRQEYDPDGDGTVDKRIFIFTYDANGNQIRQEYDSDGDGTADDIETYTYDANGNQTREEYDYDTDGTADEIYTYTYDANGNQTRREYDGDADGTADRIDSYTYEETSVFPYIEFSSLCFLILRP